ncbi:MAG: hypothetical protein ETSY2_19495 [Candidatus Entotheonella gemina]|uniref:Uncharacterized protein n=1 Tax=Candidatus Entotheonella gemina TaxID=1429439 RepID=W4M6P9_9BACT|nr:MAG: hypothetical protein ETSY2_19495 [Candidatus Entotheonella gemina]
MDVVGVVILGLIGLVWGLVLYRFSGKKNPEHESSRYGGKNDRPAEQESDKLLTKSYLSGLCD